MPSVASNIWKLNFIQALNWFMLIMPIIVLFFQDNGLSMRDILFIQAAFSVAIIVLEIPSGYFSDVLGRKPTLVIGCVLCFLGMAIYSLSGSFLWFFIAEIIMGFGASFLSGTDSAMLYDSLAEMKKTDAFKKIEGRRLAISNFSESAASIAGGLLALISLKMPFYVETGILFLAILLAMSLVEPSRHAAKRTEASFADVLNIVKYSLHDHPEVKWLILYSGAVSAATLNMVWFIQPYLQFVGLPLVYFGLAWAALNVSVGIFSLYAHKYEQALGRRLSLITLVFIVFAGYILTGITTTLFGIIFLFLFYFVRGISGPVITDYVNQIITSDLRATVLSVKGLISRLIFAIIGPFCGWMSDLYSLQTALLFSGSLFMVLGMSAVFFLYKHKAL